MRIPHKKGVPIIGALLILTMILTPVLIQNTGAARDDLKYGGTLVWGVFHKPTLINPLFTTHSVSATLASLIFNNLIRYNPKGELEADLARRWEISEDGLTYTFYLRQGVRFHDGVECTAEDVKFTLEKILDPKVDSPFRSFFSLVKELKVLDKYVFQVALSRPASDFIYRFAFKEIIPKHILENEELRNTSFGLHPVGTGPFRFKEWNKDDEITLEFNPDYYEGRPYLDKIVIKVYPDSERLWQALMRQEVDLSLFIDRRNYEYLKDDPVFKAYALPADNYYAIVYNLEDSILSDLRVRQAIAYSIDRRSLIQRVSSGYGLECNGPFYPDSPGFNPQVKPTEFNPNKAVELLTESGWQDVNQDGVLEKEGEVLEIRMLVDERSETYRQIATLIRQQFQEVGIKLRVLLYNDEKLLTPEFLAEKKAQAQLKFILAGIDPDQVATFWIKNTVGQAYSLWKYNNEEVERYFFLGKTAKDAKRKQWIYQEIHRFIYQDQPACFLYYPPFFHAVSSRFENVDNFFNINMPCYMIKEWFIQPPNLKQKGGVKR